MRVDIALHPVHDGAAERELLGETDRGHSVYRYQREIGIFTLEPQVVDRIQVLVAVLHVEDFEERHASVLVQRVDIGAGIDQTSRDARVFSDVVGDLTEEDVKSGCPTITSREGGALVEQEVAEAVSTRQVFIGECLQQEPTSSRVHLLSVAGAKE